MAIFPQLDADSLDLVLGAFSFLTLCRLRSTCKGADEAVTREIRFRLIRELSKFFPDPDKFLRMLVDTNSVVSGSVFVRIASALTFEPNDLDVYTAPDYAAQVIGILEDFGYKVLGTLDPYNPEYRGGINRIVQLGRGDRTLDVVVSLTQSSTLPIVYFWSTPVMMYFGGDGFCIPYPTLLEAGHGLLNPGRMCMDPDRLASLVAKYAERGFRIEETEVRLTPPGQVPPFCRGEQSPTCPSNVRFFGDSFCLQSAFGSVDTRINLKPFSGTLARLNNVWWRGGSGCGSDCNQGDDIEFDTWTQGSDVLGLEQQ